MKNKTKSIIQFLLVLSITISFFPYQAPASASETHQADTPVEFIITESGENSLELLLSAPAYQTSKIEMGDKTYDRIEVPGAINVSEAGHIQLPVASTLIGVPPQAEVRLEIIEDHPRQIPGTYNLAQAPSPTRINDLNSPERWDYEQQASLVETSSQATFAPARIAEEAWMRDQRVIRVEYAPFQYHADSGILDWHPNVRIKIHFSPTYNPAHAPAAHQVNPGNSPFETMFASALLNYEQARAWRAMPAASNIQTTPPEVGDRYRIAITEDGIYELTYADLFAIHPSVANFDLDKIQMTNQGEEVAIYIDDGGDGTFGPGDTITFYGQRFYGDRLADLYQDENLFWRTFLSQQTDGSFALWKPEFNALMLEKYTHENVYWIFEGTADGLRMGTVNGDPSGNGNAPVEHYRATARAEESNEWKTTLFSGEETWFWKKLQITSEPNQPPTPVLATFTTTVSAPANTGEPAVIRAEFAAENEDPNAVYDHHTKISFNSVEYGDFYWSGESRYTFEHEVTSATIMNGVNALAIEAIPIEPTVIGSFKSIIFFDWFEIEYNRLFVAEDNAITFTSEVTGTQKYQVSGFTNTANTTVLDISNPHEPIRVINPVSQSGQVTISLTHADPVSLTMSTGNITLPQNQISFYEPPDWSTMEAGFDYVFITHADLIPSTQLLANYRNGSGLSTVVIDIQDLYNEFNFGIYHPIAIKNFLAYTFDNWDMAPTYTLLVGDGHWNFHEFNLAKYGAGPQLMPPHLVWADPWQGEVDSANLLATIAGSDAFPDLMIARLPVNSNAEIDAYLSKLTGYEAPHTPEAWEQKHTFVADNADTAGNFPALADDVIADYITPLPNSSEVRIYQDDYGCSSSASAECATVRNLITNTINITGSVVLNYIGHASINRWSHERVFTPDEFPDLTNNSQLPIILSMNCLDGYWSAPIISPGPSMIEEIIRQSNTGAIGAFSPTGLGVSTGHDVLHKGFYDALMVEGMWGLGTATQNAKLWLFLTGQNMDLMHTFTVFGDPALEIRNPYGLSVSPESSTRQTDQPGSVVTHMITIENTGFVSDTYEIDISSNWDATLPYTVTAPILPGNQTSISVEIQTPNGQTSGSDTAILTIHSTGNVAESANVQLNTDLVNDLFEIFLPLLTKD